MLRFVTYCFLILFVFFWSSKTWASNKDKLPEPAECKSYISIHGSSNINEFRFYNENPIIIQNLNNTAADNHIKIPVHDFEASNDRMLRDFYEMVNASKYPFINIEIESRESADFDEQSGLTNFITEVSIAGESKKYLVPSEILGCEHTGFILKGHLEIKLTDFNIEPPTKVFGAVRVNDNVFIKFAFTMQHKAALSEKLTE